MSATYLGPQEAVKRYTEEFSAPARVLPTLGGHSKKGGLDMKSSVTPIQSILPG